MYYYILEPPANRATRQAYEKLRDFLTNSGISGEMVAASPARTPAELAIMGIEKGYTTMVAVGGDGHIGQVATAVLGRAVLGIIPVNASAQVTDLIGANNLKDAVESLKQRRLVSVSTVLLGQDIPIFLTGTIETPKLAKVSIVVDNRMRVFAYFNKISINRDLEVAFESEHIVEPKKILGLFKVGGETITSHSLFHGKLIRLVTDPELPFRVGGQEMAQTPLTLRLVPDSLKVITRRGKLE